MQSGKNRIVIRTYQRGGDGFADAAILFVVVQPIILGQTKAGATAAMATGSTSVASSHRRRVEEGIAAVPGVLLLVVEAAAAEAGGEGGSVDEDADAVPGGMDGVNGGSLDTDFQHCLTADTANRQCRAAAVGVDGGRRRTVVASREGECG